MVLRSKLTEFGEEGELSFARWQLFTVIVNLLLWSNFSFNFFFYFMSGTLFKREWKRIMEKVAGLFKRHD
jgi:hypothetical protein